MRDRGKDRWRDKNIVNTLGTSRVGGTSIGAMDLCDGISELKFVNDSIKTTRIVSYGSIEITGQDDGVALRVEAIQCLLKVKVELFAWFGTSKAVFTKQGPLLGIGSFRASVGDISGADLITAYNAENLSVRHCQVGNGPSSEERVGFRAVKSTDKVVSDDGTGPSWLVGSIIETGAM